MSSTFFADTPVGRLINNVSSGRFLPKVEEVKGFTLPDSLSNRMIPRAESSSPSTLVSEEEKGEKKERIESIKEEAHSENDDVEAAEPAAKVLSRVLPNGEAIARAESRSRVAPIPHVEATEKDQDVVVVDWYGEDDPENPVNWSRTRKLIATLSICFLTFSVYAGSSIVTPSIPGMIEEFHVSGLKGTLSLSVFIMGYAVVSSI
jgi:DHA1 family multidrug resistance protein-like MFS transporter